MESVIGQARKKRILKMTVGRVGNHSGRFVYDGVVFIFEHYSDIRRGGKGGGVILILKIEPVAGLNRVLNAGMDTVKLHCSVELYTLDPGGAHLELAPHDLLDFQAVIFTFNKIFYSHCLILTNY